jgi:uncharacterized protein YcaQ
LQTLSRVQARRVALVAQGFRDPRHTVPTMRTFNRTLARTGVLQVDSVNVLARAHYMPLFSRMGPYDPGMLERASAGRERRRVVEYWAHVQAFMPVDLWPVMQHRMASYRAQRGKWKVMAARPELEAGVIAAIRDRGASTARELDDGDPVTKEHWGWNWSDTRKVLDYLYMVGDLAIAGRNGSFEVRYDLPERVLPRHVLETPVPDLADANRELVRRAAVSHGVASVGCLADYYRMKVAEVRPAVDELVEAGELVPIRVEGWAKPAYLHRDAALPRRVHARAVLSPFDPLVWLRDRTEHLFGFRYRIEIYVPAHKRVHGYYVLPFLLEDRLVGRVDLKADRQAGTLVVRSAFAEPDAPAGTADELAEELGQVVEWLGLSAVVVEDRGDLARDLAGAVHRVQGG